MAIKSYKTNAVCPRCGANLYTQDYISEYPLCCPDCCEDFCFIENAEYTVNNPNPVFEVYIPIKGKLSTSELCYIVHLKCREILPDANFVYDTKNNELQISFNDYMDLIYKSEGICFPIRNIGRYIDSVTEIDKDFVLENLKELYEYCNKVCKESFVENEILSKELGDDEEDIDIWIENRRALLAAIQMLSIEK